MSDYSHDATSTPTPATPALADAMVAATEALAYHDKRMGKRLRRLKGEEAFEDEPSTGVTCAVVPDPFPPAAARRA